MKDEKICDKQIALLKLAVNYIQKKELSSNACVYGNPEYYLNAWSEDSLGSCRLRTFYQGINAYISLYLLRLKNLKSVFIQRDFEQKTYTNIKKYKHIIVSWSKEENFASNGVFTCPYFGVQSNSNDDCLWFLISLDKKIPANVSENIILFSEAVRKNYNIFRIIKNVCQIFIENKSFAYEWQRNQMLTQAFQTVNEISKSQSIILPYEAQPWQHSIAHSLRKKNSGVKILGYVHSSLPPLPTDYIYRQGAPDLIITHGDGTKKILAKNLAWNASQISVIKSMRYNDKNQKDVLNKILIPYSFNDEVFYLKQLEIYFKNLKDKIIPLTARCHPVMQSDPKHQMFLLKINELIQKNSDVFDVDSKNSVSIVLGNSTCVLECLAKNIKVIHIVENPLTQIYSSNIWSDIIQEEISDHIFTYTQKKKGSYILLNDKDPNLNEILQYA